MDMESERRPMVTVAAVVAVACLGWFFVRPALASPPAPLPVSAGVTTTIAEVAAESASPITDDVESAAAPGDPSASAESGADAVSDGAVSDASDPVASDPEPAARETNGTSDEPADEQAETAGDVMARLAPTLTTSGGDGDGDGDGDAATEPTAETPSYPTLPDGSPSPIIAIYDVDTITLTGPVPSEAARNRLETLALANSQFPDAVLVSLLTIDPTVPPTIGVRVVEKTSSRFPDGSADVVPAHAAELDRAAALLNALDNVTALVIGHADQRGGEQSNYALSEARAQSVVRYLVGAGIDPSRLSSRAVGEADLITLNDDSMALALNRRTEFVFYGVLVES